LIPVTLVVVSILAYALTYTYYIYSFAPVFTIIIGNWSWYRVARL